MTSRCPRNPDTQHGTYTYDARNRVTDTPDGTVTWSNRGTMTGAGNTTYQFDALGRQVKGGPNGYRYDSLDRVVDAGPLAAPVYTFTYAGTELDPVSDGTATYGRGPGGDLVSIDPVGPALLTPAVWAGTNPHGDLSWMLNPTNRTLTGTRIYDPFGQTAGQTGLATLEWPNLGFQADWTDPNSGNVWQGARWYRPTTATFTARDTIAGELARPISLNRYTYAFGNPLRFWDPDGRYGFDGAYTTTKAADGPGSTTTAGGGTYADSAVPLTTLIPTILASNPGLSHDYNAARTARAQAWKTHLEVKRRFGPAFGNALIPKNFKYWPPEQRHQYLAQLQLESGRDYGPSAGRVAADSALGLLKGAGRMLLGAGELLSPSGASQLEFAMQVREDGYLVALNARYNPVYQLLAAGDTYWRSVTAGRYVEAGQDAVSVIGATVATIGVAAGATQAARGVSARSAPSAVPNTTGLRSVEQAGIAPSDALRIQNAANRTHQRITVVGSRAEGTAGPLSDWDYIFSGPSHARQSAKTSVPRGKAGGELDIFGRETGIDRWQDYNPGAPGYNPLDPLRPHVIFDPQ